VFIGALRLYPLPLRLQVMPLQSRRLHRPDQQRAEHGQQDARGYLQDDAERPVVYRLVRRRDEVILAQPERSVAPVYRPVHDVVWYAEDDRCQDDGEDGNLGAMEVTKAWAEAVVTDYNVAEDGKQHLYTNKFILIKYSQRHNYCIQI